MSDNNKENQKLYNNCINMLFSWGKPTFKQNIKRFVRKHVLRQNVAPVDRWFWPQAMLADGILSVIRSGKCAPSERERGLNALKKYYDMWIEGKQPVYYVDNAMHGINLLELYELTGEKRYLEAADHLADYLMHYPVDADGNMGYRLRTSHLVFADALGMICPFLCRYGAMTGKTELVNLGVLQLMNFLESGMDPISGLPYHGYDSKTGVKQGCVGWGRAVGWLMMGLCGSLKYLSETHSDYAVLKEFKDLLEKEIWKYQRADGGFSWLLPAVEGPADTSATAMIIGALLLNDCDKKDTRKEQKISEAVAFLDQHLNGGNVDCASGECEGFGEYPQRYGVYPWGNGMVLTVINGCED